MIEFCIDKTGENDENNGKSFTFTTENEKCLGKLSIVNIKSK